MNDFKEKYRFDPNTAAKEISSEQLLKFADLVKDTPSAKLIAYKDPKVQELIDYITSAIILENQRMNSMNAFPVQIYRRYKADNSLEQKINEWSTRPEKRGEQVTDYLGFKIIPEAQHSIFFSDNDPILAEMINKRERIRAFIAEKYEMLSQISTMSFQEYASHCMQVLVALQDVFPPKATARIEYYNTLKNNLANDLIMYAEIVEDANTPMPLENIAKVTNIDIKKLLAELTFNYPNEVLLYKLKQNLMNVFQNSELLKSLRY